MIWIGGTCKALYAGKHLKNRKANKDLYIYESVALIERVYSTKKYKLNR